jgi:hypothetical protein
VLRCKPYQVAEIKLPPGDRLVLLTDGMLERGAAALDLSSRLPPLSELHPGEVVHVLAGPVLPTMRAF